VLQKWHRANELPAYADILQRLQRMAPADATPAQACELLTDVRERALALGAALEPTVVAIAPMLSREQIAHLEQKLAKRNREWRKEWIDAEPAERTARRVKQTIERAERFYGPLEEKQLAAVREMVAASAFDARLTLRETLRRQHDALRTLRHLHMHKPDAPATRAMLLGLFERSVHSPDAAYRGYLEELTRSICQGIAALHNSTTPAQRARAAQTLNAYETDLRTLAAQR
jgi:hypothetical protein